MMTFDEELNITDVGGSFRGEDPRSFFHNNKMYIVDNTCDDVHLYDGHRYILVPLPGKNFTFLSHEKELYVIHTMIPLVIYKMDLEHEILTLVHQGTEEPNNEYRGGTPAYNGYYGYGHRTHIKDGVTLHDVYKWNLNMETFNLKIEDLPKTTMNITDPTCVILLDGVPHLVTAESDKPWCCEQDYVTNLYRLENVCLETSGT